MVISESEFQVDVHQLREIIKTSGELQNGYQNELARDASNARNIDSLPPPGNSSAEQ